uniref:Uncharacterized protein n=1 Tax=Lactuca sativa TaxID=4236 RepID=A0A9R1V336_LACSA|nr:hypothetical protein LSAT_V11C600319940 [Lactuca sativa]
MGCLLLCEDGSEERFYGCIIDVDAHETLRLLGEEATNEERKMFEAFNYVYSDVFLHNDKSQMPRNRTTWSALNFLGTKDNKVCLTYWLNVLQSPSSRHAAIEKIKNVENNKSFSANHFFLPQIIPV